MPLKRDEKDICDTKYLSRSVPFVVFVLLHILNNGVDDFRGGIRRAGIDTSLDFIAATREAFGHRNIVRDRLRQFDDERVFVFACRFDGLRDAVEGLTRNRHDGQLVA